MIKKFLLSRKKTGETEPSVSRRTRAILGALAAAVVVTVLIALHVVTDATASCIWCHGEHGQLWAASTHKTVDCVECHVDPGIGGAVHAKLRGARNVFVSIARGNEVEPGEEPLPVSTENCFACHAGVLRVNEMGYQDLPANSLKADGLVMDHRVHVEKHGIDCVWCHRGTVHRDPAIAGKYEFNMPLHGDCRACHNGEYIEQFDMTLPHVEDKSGCTDCHPTYEGPTEDSEY